jgi:hypothetical protein
MQSKSQQTLIQQRLEFWNHIYKVNIHAKVNGEVKTGASGSGCMSMQDAVKRFNALDEVKDLGEVIPLWLDGVAYLESTPRHIMKSNSSKIPSTWRTLTFTLSLYAIVCAPYYRCVFVVFPRVQCVSYRR